MKLTMLGTGNALVTKCYNTCFIITGDDGQHLLVDGGGGNTVLTNIRNAGLNWMDMRHIFVTHRHIDHILGIIWMMRLICQYMNSGKYEGEAYIYSHAEVIDLLRDMAGKLLQKKQAAMIGERLHLVTVSDGETLNIIGHDMTFFDIHSTKANQFGFTMAMDNGEKLTCCGDEPYCEAEYEYAKNSTWLLHEAFCLYSQREKFKPYEKHHSTVKDACELAESLGVKNLVLYHSEDENYENRKKLYGDEGKPYYSGNIFIPDDLEVIEL